MNIYEKLSAIQNELKAPKSQYNSFGKYKYRNCEDILEAVKPLCKENKATLVIEDEIQLVGERFYVKAIATLYDQESDYAVHSIAFAREEESKKGMDGSQVTGASSSYARKYALNGLFNIDDTKDSDTTNNGQEPKAEPKDAKVKPDLAKTIEELINITGTDKAKFLDYFKVKKVADLTVKQGDDAYIMLQKKLPKEKS